MPCCETADGGESEPGAEAAGELEATESEATGGPETTELAAEPEVATVTVACDGWANLEDSEEK